MKGDEEVKNSIDLFKDLLNQPLMDHNGKDFDANAIDAIMDPREYNKMENKLKVKQTQRE